MQSEARADTASEARAHAASEARAQDFDASVDEPVDETLAHAEAVHTDAHPRDSEVSATEPIDETAAHTKAVRASAPSQLCVEAERAHDSRNTLDAAVLWVQCATGIGRDTAEHRARAEYLLGVALLRLGLPHASLPWFRAAAEDRQHPMHLAALGRLGELAERLPEFWITSRLFSSYTLLDLDRLKHLDIAAHDRIAYFLGRGLYLTRDFEQAALAFIRVGPSSTHFLEARLFEAACHVRRHRSVPALKSLERGIKSIEQREVRPLDPDRWLDLFNLSRGRIYYSSAIALDRETNIPKLHPSRLSAAVKFYNELAPESEYFPEATFELAWVYFMSGQYTFALGKVFTLDAPYYEQDFHPEAQILKAVVYFANCNYDAASISTARFNKRYIPIRDAIKRVLKQMKSTEPGRFVRVLDELHNRPSALGPALEPSVSSIYRQREFLRMLRTMGEVEAEIAKVSSWQTSSQTAILVNRLRENLLLQRAEAASRADQWLRDFLQRRIDTIDDLVHSAARTSYYFDFWPQRNLLDIKLKSGQVSKIESNDWGRVRGDEEHVIWPFDGEYWRDELATYRQTVLSTCGR